MRVGVRRTSPRVGVAGFFLPLPLMRLAPAPLLRVGLVSERQSSYTRPSSSPACFTTFRTSEYPLEWIPDDASPSTTSPGFTRVGFIARLSSTTPTQNPAR